MSNRFSDAKKDAGASSPATSPATPPPPFDGSTWPPPHVPDPLPPHWWRQQARVRLRFARKVSR